MNKLSSDTVRFVCSGQVITSPSSVVKELVENAVDAGATIIDVRLEDCGLAKIEVRDNGNGIPTSCRHAMALPHYTSKIVQFEDLNEVITYGFRGEALASINSVGILSATTRTSSDNIASTYEFDKSGAIKSTKTSPLQVGTTVIVGQLFKDLPVRKQFFKGKKGKEQVDTSEHFLKGMAIARPSIRFMLRHNQKLIWQHAKSDQLKNAITSAYASVADMLPFGFTEGSTKVDGMLSVTTFSKHQPFIIINGRVVKCKALVKCVKALYNGNHPKGAIKIFVDPKSVDVNVEVDKSNLIFQNEAALFTQIEASIQRDILSSLEGSDEPAIEVPAALSSEPHSCHSNLLPSETDIISTEQSLSTENITPLLECEEEIQTLPKPVINQPNNSDDIELFSAISKTVPVATNNACMTLMANMRKNKTKELWSDLETELLGDDTPQSPSVKLPNMIYDDHESCPPTPGTPSQLKLTQTTMFSPSGESPKVVSKHPYNEEFSPSDPTPAKKATFSRPIQPKRIEVDPTTQPSIKSFSQNVSPEIRSPFSAIGNKAKKRDKSVSPKVPEKRRKLESPSKNSMIFKMPNPTRPIESQTTAPTVLSTDNKWFVIKTNTLYAFNPYRAQEVNIMNKLMSFYTLKTGPCLSPELSLDIADVGATVFTSLIQSETYFDNMGSCEYIRNKLFTLNGMRVKKIDNGRFAVVNVTEEIEGFSKEDVVETLVNIFSDQAENSRCERVLRYFEGKAKCLGHTKFSNDDVLDLFSNTKTNKCCHGNTFVKSIWDLQLSQNSQHFGDLSFEEQLSDG